MWNPPKKAHGRERGEYISTVYVIVGAFSRVSRVISTNMVALSSRARSRRECNKGIPYCRSKNSPTLMQSQCCPSYIMAWRTDWSLLCEKTHGLCVMLRPPPVTASSDLTNRGRNRAKIRQKKRKKGKYLDSSQSEPIRTQLHIKVEACPNHSRNNGRRRRCPRAAAVVVVVVVVVASVVVRSAPAATTPHLLLREYVRDTHPDLPERPLRRQRHLPFIGPTPFKQLLYARMNYSACHHLHLAI